MESKKQPYEQIKQKQTHEHREQADSCQMERGWREGQKKVKGNKTYKFPVIK